MEQVAYLLIIAVTLSMDAFAVSVCKGLSAPKWNAKNGWLSALYFGGFQALMPLMGYLLGVQLQSFAEEADHWVAFVLLTLIGINMIREACGEGEMQNSSFSPRTMLPLAVATSIDALVVGVTFPTVLDIPIYWAVPVIGLITGVLSFLGVRLGQIIGTRWQKKAAILGGVLLIGMGMKVIWEHLDLGARIFSFC